MYRQVDGSRACVTPTLDVPSVIVALRATPLFAATLKAIDPLPMPLVLDVIATQDALEVALQEQSLSVVTAIEPLPPV